MPNGATYGRQVDVSNFRHMNRMGPSESEMARFLYPFAWRSVTFIFDDFVGGGMVEAGVTDFNEGWWWSDTSANGTDFEAKATQIAGGAATGVTGAFAGDTTMIIGAAIWLGDQNCGMEVRYKTNNITSQQWEIGFTDPLSDEKVSAVDDIDTPSITNGAADVALVAQDTGQTLTTMAFVTDGSTSNMNTTSTELGTRTPTNATYQAVRVQLAGNTSFGYVLDNNGGLQEAAAHGALIGSQIEGGTLVRPRAFWEALTTSARTIDIDYIGVWQDRA